MVPGLKLDSILPEHNFNGKMRQYRDADSGSNAINRLLGSIPDCKTIRELVKERKQRLEIQWFATDRFIQTLRSAGSPRTSWQVFFYFFFYR